MLIFVYINQCDLNKGLSKSTESAFLISCIGKIDKFPKCLVVVSEHMVLKL